MINYNGKTFLAVSHSTNGETIPGSEFFYQQTGAVLTCTYTSTNVACGHLIALVDEQGKLDMRYHQVNIRGELMTGICKSEPEIMPNGKIRLREKWKWTSGDFSQGESIIEEL